MSEAAEPGQADESGAPPPADGLYAYTDGACSGNPGPGGWGVVFEAIRDGALAKSREIAGGEAETTNNRMELMAAIAALETLDRPSTITVVTDSSYLKDGITGWIHGWKRNGWKTASKKPVKNAELWQRLDAAQTGHKVSWLWVKGHAGHAQNERADALARAEIKRLKTAAT
ncbi:MAG: ribonuclease HI [Pseudomonadota bacterium]